MSKYYHRGKWNMRELSKESYKPGQIVRIKMVNFLTFDECEVFPGPKLNVILGPNGTGKSSITHALCLACGGSPVVLGRSTDLTQFVKHGKENEESYVEIDVISESMESVETIRRNISTENRRSLWRLNNRESTMKAVKEIMTDLSIDMDNLCTFMPQDRVGLFSQLTPKEILSKTLEAIKMPSSTTARPKTYHDVQLELADHEAVKIQKQKDVQLKRNQLEKLLQLKSSMQTEVDRMQNREELKQKKVFYGMKLAVKVYRESTLKTQSFDQEIQAENVRLNEARDKLQPLELRERNMKRDISSMESMNEKITRELNTHETKVTKLRDAMDEIDMSVDKTSNDLRNMDAEYRENIRKSEIQRQLVMKCEDDITKAEESVPILQEKLQALKTDYQTKSEALNAYQMDIQSTQRLINVQQQELSNDMKNLSELKDFKQIFKHRLNNIKNSNQNRMFQDVMKAMDWIESNRHRFQGEVYGPVALYLNVEDEACAIMIEKIVPLNRLLGFVVETENDAHILKQEVVRQQNLKIDVYTMKNQVVLPYPYDRNHLHSLGNIGIQGFIGDFFTCPDIIRNYLYMFTGLHNVIWSRFNETIHDQSLLSSKNFTHFLTSSLNSFRFYVHYVQENHSSSRQLHEDYHIVEYSGQRSRYANPDSPPVLSSIAISAKGIVGKVEDESFQRQKEALENIITTKQTNIRLQSVEMENKQKEFHDLQRQIVTINDERKRIQQMLQYPNELKRKLQIEKRKLNDLEMKLKFNIDEEKMKLRKVYDDHITTMMTSLQEMVKNVEAYNIVIMKSQLIQLQREYKNDQLRSLQSELREANEQVRIIQGSIKLIERQRETAERDMKKAEEELNEIVEKCGGQEGFQEEYKKAKQMCPEETIQDIRDQLAVVAGELELSIDNPEVIERYEATCQELKTTEAELQTLTTSFEQSDRNLQEQSEEWLTGVRDIARKLNEGFHDYMNELQFQGEVTLKETGRFDEYEIQMKVSFRLNEDMVELSGFRHSGGERAVSTIMYLMAMQQLTSVPFRVVDEINQGMDERNERLVIDRIVQNCCCSASLTSSSSSCQSKPQYFLVSPKLLQALMSLNHDDVTVLVVFNGPGVRQLWHLSQILDSASGRKRSLAHGSKKKVMTEEEEESLLGDSDEELDRSPIKSSNKLARRRYV